MYIYMYIYICIYIFVFFEKFSGGAAELARIGKIVYTGLYSSLKILFILFTINSNT
jgi:hypothetical protein